MRGRLPETGLAPALLQGLTAIITEESSSTSSAMNIGEEEASFQEHIRTIDDQVRRLLSESSSKVALYTLTQHERSALLGIARIVQHDRRVLQGNLFRAGRPPDQRDGECRRAPDWDSAYLAALVANWGEPVLLEADYYLLRSQSLFELGTSVEVKVLGPDHVKRYMSMALELTQKGYAAANTIAEIRQHEAVVNLPASDELYENARHQVTQTLQSFYRGIQYYPSIFNSSDELSKDQEWSSMAELTESFSVLVDDFLARQVWIQNTIRLLKGAIQESKTRRDRQLLLISKAHLGLALWIYEQPDKPLLLVPRVSPLFQEMQCTALAGKILVNKGRH
ncbi:hypothetical protein EDD11_002573 [Mortierella claussenii]|nr:hypothetical protein EDD11_002573 [Mortierella claussenii]